MFTYWLLQRGQDISPHFRGDQENHDMYVVEVDVSRKSEEKLEVDNNVWKNIKNWPLRRWRAMFSPCNQFMAMTH